MSDDLKLSKTDEEALALHKAAPAGKIALKATKPMATQRDLALAYSPGVAAPVRAIHADPDAVYDYTSKGNTVAVVSNGTAILGLGDLGPAASKPVMEGKAVLFKRFADIDAFDLEIKYTDPDRFIDCVAGFGDTFGGINLEDIKSPECFEIEQRLREELDIPVFHDDQHGTAIIAAAGLMNACHLTERKLEEVKVSNDNGTNTAIQGTVFRTKPKQKVTFTAGDYYLTEIDTAPNSEIYVDDTGGPVRFFVEGPIEFAPNNGLPLNDAPRSVPMGIAAGGAGTYTLSVDDFSTMHPTTMVWLEDKTTGT